MDNRTENKDIYLDNSATTPLSDAVKRKISQMLDVYGNPSSLHSVGQLAEAELRRARESLLERENFSLPLREPRLRRLPLSARRTQKSAVMLLVFSLPIPNIPL